MQAEQCCDDHARPKGFRHPHKHDEHEKGVGCVQEKARDVMAAGRKSIELAVEHVRQPGQWMPESRLAVRERPADTGCGETCLHMPIGCHIHVVVEVDEFEAPDWPVEEHDAEKEDRGDQGERADGQCIGYVLSIPGAVARTLHRRALAGHRGAP